MISTKSKKYSEEELVSLWQEARKRYGKVPKIAEFKAMGLPDINFYNRAFKNYTTFLQKQGEDIPDVIYKKKSNIKRYYSPNEWMNFLSIISNYDHRFWIEFLLHTGMRYDEAANVHVKDIDFSTRVIAILSPKGGNQMIRQIKVSSYLINRISNYSQTKHLSPNSTFIFPTNAGLNYMIQKYTRQAGLQDWYDFTCHNLRKTLIMWACALNINSSNISHFVGHTVRTEEAFYTSSMLFNAEEKQLIKSILGDLFV